MTSTTVREIDVWGRINQSKKGSIDSSWLFSIFSRSFSNDLRFAIAERLGLMGQEGWQKLKQLIIEEGVLSELIYACGLCCQKEAKNWLLDEFKKTNENKLEILQALSSWGGISFNSVSRRCN